MGYAKHVKEIGFGTTQDRMLLIEGCPNRHAVTIFVRGGNHMIVDETKRSIHDALCVARNLVRDSHIVYGGGAAEISCSLAIELASNEALGATQYAMRAFAEALESIPQALAENSGLSPLDIVTAVKKNQLETKNSKLGVDCNGMGTNCMKTQNVFETLIGKKQMFFLATQVCKMILKIDDVIQPSNYE